MKADLTLNLLPRIHPDRTRCRRLMKELDNESSEVLPYFENQIKKRYDIYEQMAGSGKGEG